MGILGLLPADHRMKMDPLDEGHLADVDDDLLALVGEDKETYVASRIPEKYRRLLRRVPGEKIIESASGTETTAQLSLYPVTELRLYRNWHCTGRPWSDRRHSDALVEGTDYTLDPETGLITLLFQIREDDSLWADYRHEYPCRLLRAIALNLSACELARRLQFPTEQFEKYQDWETQGYSDLKRMTEVGEGRLCIDEFDKLELVVETRGGRMAMEDADPLGGW